MKSFLKKIFGIDKLEEEARQAVTIKATAEQEAQQALAAAAEAREDARLAKMSPKEIANEKKEPWVAVLETHVNEQNPRNGFFELDWNEYFVLQLKVDGYYGETDEEIVDKWFSELCKNVGSESGVSMDRRGSGYINVNNIGGGKSEVS